MNAPPKNTQRMEMRWREHACRSLSMSGTWERNVQDLTELRYRSTVQYSNCNMHIEHGSFATAECWTRKIHHPYTDTYLRSNTIAQCNCHREPNANDGDGIECYVIIIHISLCWYIRCRRRRRFKFILWIIPKRKFTSTIPHCVKPSLTQSFRQQPTRRGEERERAWCVRR